MKKTIVLLLPVVLFACQQQNSRPENTFTAPLIAEFVEITTFRLNPGIAEDVFLTAAEQMQRTFLNKQAGFVKRTLTYSADSVWVDIVYWKDQHSAEQAMQQAERSAEALPFMEKIDLSSIEMRWTSPKLTTEYE